MRITVPEQTSLLKAEALEPFVGNNVRIKQNGESLVGELLAVSERDQSFTAGPPEPEDDSRHDFPFEEVEEVEIL